MIQTAPKVVDHRPHGSRQFVQAAQDVAIREDEHLCERVRRVLQAPGYHQLRHVQVSAHDGTVVLQGRVGSYYLKQVAQTQVLGLADVRSVQNKLIVADPSEDNQW